MAENSVRRRRVLTEQVMGAQAETAEDGSTAVGGARRRAPTYADGALRSQAAVSDFLPRRYRTIALVAAIAITSLAALESLHYYAPRWREAIPGQGLATLDLTSPAGLATWMASALFALAGSLSLLIFSVRRHKLDDYRGRYRIWLLAAAVCWLASVDTVAAVRLAVGDLGEWLSAARWGGDATLWWAAPAAVFAGYVAIRVAIDIRRCRLALATFILAGVAWGASLLADRGTLPLDGVAETMTTAGCRLAANWLLVIALVVFGRHIVLDAGGMLKNRSGKSKKSARAARRKAENAAKDSAAKGGEGAKSAGTTTEGKPANSSSGSSDKQVRIDAPHRGVPSPAAAGKGPLTLGARPSPASASSSSWTSSDEDEDDEDEDNGGERLSRAERRRLRKLKARQER